MCESISIWVLKDENMHANQANLIILIRSLLALK